jgi:3-oxoacyl-[acyl-carrier protein] reductase
MAEAGALVVMAAHRFDTEEATAAKAAIEAKGGLALEVDVVNEAALAQMVADTVAKYGRIDALVNNAAMYGGISRTGLLETPPEEWDRLMTVNLKGPFLTCRAVVPQMKKQGGGKIVNIASEVAFTGSKGMIHYVTSKGGVLAFTKALAAELGQFNICTNAVAPGYTDTAASRTLGDTSKYDTSKTPLARLEKPEDLVGAVMFLASDEADFITGQTLVVDGGRYMH